MKTNELRSRVQRFLAGDHRVADLNRVFLALRDGCYGRASIREIGDFVAHREHREKGPVTDAVRDILLSFRSCPGGRQDPGPRHGQANQRRKPAHRDR